MSNIMITEKCNLKCPYCFASEVMKGDDTNIDLNEFSRIIDFVARTEEAVGLIGGEPLLHPGIDAILNTVIDHIGIKKAILFTNGVNIDRHIELLTHPKIDMLVNYNGPAVCGEAAFRKTTDNLEMMFRKYRMDYKVKLGLNIYDPRQDTDYFIDEAVKLGVESVRISITVPPDKSIGYKEYFRNFIPLVKKFISRMNKKNIAVNFDCNLIPICLIDRGLERVLAENEDLPGCHRKYLTTDKCTRCNPVIDIDIHGVAIRCFGMSNGPRYNISEYNDTREIYAHMFHETDQIAIDKVDEECRNCHWNKVNKCYGGCMAFRFSKAPNVKWNN